MTVFTGLVCATVFEPDLAELPEIIGRLRSLGLECAIFDNTAQGALANRVRTECELRQISYLTDSGNVGTAGALNAFLAHASGRGLDWLLYLDQDTVVGREFASRAQASTELVDSRVVLIGSRIIHASDGSSRAMPEEFSPTSMLISSGTAMRVSALIELDGFDQCLGLDLVDHEICLRIRGAGLSAVIDQARWIRHEIGAGSHEVGVIRRRVTEHPPWRRRQMWRNSVILVRRYWVLEPTSCLRHMLGRLLDTMLTAIDTRSLSPIRVAIFGIREGLQSSSRRIGLTPIPDEAKTTPWSGPSSMRIEGGR